MELVLRLLKSVSQKSACYSYCFYLLILFCISWYIDLLPCLHLYLFVCLFMSSLYLFFRSFIHPFIHLLIWLFVSLFVKSLWLLVVIGYPMCSVVSSLCLPTYLLMSLYTLMYVYCCKLLIIFHLFTCQFMHRFICLTFIFGNCWPDDLRTFGSRLKIATLKSEEVTGWKWMCFVIVEKQVVPLSCWQEDKNREFTQDVTWKFYQEELPSWVFARCCLDWKSLGPLC